MTTIRRDYPHEIREIKNTWIPLSDGTRIAARIWMPVDAEQHPVPAIFEYIPYRKNDSTAERDALMHPYFAGFGYAAVRVDMRGSGDSDGILYDEYLKQEQDDGLEILAWIAEQPWCSGEIGMIGISWGGFNGLQIAARRPPQLKTVITVGSTDDRYSDDVHYMGGCVLGIEMLEWATAMLLYTSKPPDPLHVGERWREMWMERLGKSPAMIDAWLGHQRRDEYWQHGSVCEDYTDIQCPVYAINGWADGYTNSVLRLAQNLPGPRKGLIGPWGHSFPHKAYPGPSIGFLQECLRWFDRWLKSIPNGIMDEPLLRAWILDGQPVDREQHDWPGHWVAETDWPPQDASTSILYLTPHGLSEEAEPESKLQYGSTFLAGLNAGMWSPYGQPGDLPPDQRQDDGCSLTFDSPPLSETQEILGFPEVHLELSVDRPNALVVVRLCDVAPTGESTLVSRGMLNLTHRQSHLEPSPLEPGVHYRVSVQMNAIGYSLPAGHRWRVAVTPAYWPHAWPSPELVTLSVYTNEHSYLALPVRPPRPADAELQPFEPPEVAPPLEVEVLRRAPRQWQVNRDLPNGVHEIVDHYDLGLRRLVENDLTFGGLYRDVYTIQEGQPLSAKVRCLRQHEMKRGDWRVHIVVNSTMTCDAHNFYVTNQVEAYEGSARLFTRSSDHTFKRDLV